MPSNTCLIVVEGPHDIEFVARLLRPAGFTRIQSWEELPEYWRAIVPQKFPVGNDLLARHPVPTFFRNKSGQTVAVRSANGIDRITTSLSDTLSQLSTAPEAVGIVLDADQALSPTDRHTKFLAEWARKPNHELLIFSDSAGLVNRGMPKAGVFVLPDNVNSGTLEDLFKRLG